ncbi:MAG: S8 family serine peptidase [Deltaproteobacteria bacterium]|nr:S8 family serine peptidase [Deltaproteobacteria bacterium]
MRMQVRTWLGLALGALVAGSAPPARAEFPYPGCARADNACDPACPVGDDTCVGPDDYADYLFLPPPTPGDPAEMPDDYDFNPAAPDAGSGWKYQGEISGGPADGLVGGLNLVEGWQVTTGRPDVVVAVLDSGIRWSSPDVARKVALRTWELPFPADANPPAPCTGPGHDCNGDGVVSVDDFEGITCHGLAGATVVAPGLGGDPARLDGQDILRACSDGHDGYGSDSDANGFVDDITGWDFQDDDNDPFDDVDYGHGTGQAEDMAAEANNGTGFPGTAPNQLYLPLKVGDSFVAIGTDFARAVVYAADWPVAVVSEALGAISAGPSGQQAIDYAYARGIPLIASAADEEAQHHNYPANYDHTIWVNSIRNGDDELVPDHTPSEGGPANLGFDLLNGCTNYGPHAWVSIPSTSCSSEATGRAAGVAALIVSHGRNLVDQGLLAPYCVASGDCTGDAASAFSAEEVRQIFRFLAEDVDHSPDGFQLFFTPTFGFLANLVLSGPSLSFGNSHFEAGPGFDPFTGHGRPDVGRLATLVEPGLSRIPPEADLSGGLRWFETVDPVATPSVDIRGTARAVRTPGGFSFSVAVGCGNAPGEAAFVEIDSGFSLTGLDGATLASWDPAATAAGCGFDPAAGVASPDDHTVTLRLRVTDTAGNVGEDRRAVGIHHDATLLRRVHLGASLESSPALVDVDRDGVLDVVVGTGAGELHVLAGASGTALPGFPVRTDALPVHQDDPASGFASGAVAVPHEVIGGAVAADDLDGDGRVEIVAAGAEGAVYVWDDVGARRPGFPVWSDPALSDPAHRDALNDSDPGFFSAPTLVDLDPPGESPGLEIVLGGFDGHLYAWRADGTPVAGFPVRLADTARVSLDPVSGRATALPGSGAKERARKIVGSPAAGDLDGDGRPELVVGTTEEYGGNPIGWSAPSGLLSALLGFGFADALDLDTTGRVYAVHADGTPVAGWPVETPQLTSQLLPSVATGVSTSVALADTDGNGSLEAALYSHAGPALLVDGAGAPVFGVHGPGSLPRPFAIDFAGGGFPGVPATAGSADAPFFPSLGSGAFGDLDQDGLPEFVAATSGLRKLLDVQVPGRQETSHHQIAAWNADPASSGELVPAFPQVMEDMQFIASPALADVTGDGVPDVVQGSGTYLVRAFEILDDAAEAAAAGVPTGSAVQPEGWPKLTLGWALASPTPGDVDGDGLIEVVAVTREGDLFVWNTPAPATDASIPWQGFGRDRRNTQNLSSGVSPLATPREPLESLLWVLQSIHRELRELAEDDPRLARAFASLVFPYVVQHIEVTIDPGVRLRPTPLLLGYLSLTPVRPEWADFGPLQLRLQESVADTAERQVAAIECAPGDFGCGICRWFAAAQLFWADHSPLPLLEVLNHSLALSTALNCE